ncbi:MAG TPA: NlpC/P60 family protein [Nitrospirota bacterium]
MNKPLHILGALWCAFMLLAVAAFAQGPTNEGVGIVSAPLANVHEEPLPKSHLETQVLMGDEVRILESRDNRYRIAIPSQENRKGWVQQEAVHVPKDKGRAYLNADRKRIVIATPKADALILDKTGNHRVSLYAGTRLPVIETTPKGLKVQFPDKSVAIVSASETLPAKPSDPVTNETKPEELAKTARLFQGVRYLDGGLSEQGIDTHGLIHIVYRVHGIAASAEPAALKAQAERVSKKDLEPGDILVFYGENQGLYLGNGHFLHAARKGTVQISGISDRKFANALQYGLRVIGAGPSEKKRVAELTADEMLLAQARAAKLPIGKRIAYWAGRFIGTPYDPDPLGLYVRTNRIVADEKADCMYHAFRSVELARSSTPAEAVDQALNLRFVKKGKLSDGLVVNYDERFQYGEDMVFSNKWGRNVTADLGETKQIAGSRGKETVDILPKNVLATRAVQKNLQDGDIIYWVKDPKKRVVEEIVAHLSIVRLKNNKPYLIHAAGDKDREGRPGGGVVKEVPFADYVQKMKFIGAFVTRFEQ